MSNLDLIADYQQHLIGRRRAESTIEDYTKILRRMDRQLPAGLCAATTEELEDWIFAGQRSDNTLLHYTTIVKGFAAWATDPRDPRLDYNAAADLPDISAQAEHPTRAATPEEVADLLARADDLGKDLFTLAAFAGYRCVEISRGRREHVTEQETRIYGKGGRLRRMATHPALWARFADRPAGALARDRDGTPLSRQQVIARGAHRIQSLGYEDLSMHSLRKFFGTQVYEASDRDIRVAQDLLGHAHITTTQLYVAVNRARAAGAVLAVRLPS